MVEKRTFEQSMGELENVVRQLEGGDITLDDSLAAFEKGVALTRECDAILNEAKGKIEKLVRESGGEWKTEAFEPKE